MSLGQSDGNAVGQSQGFADFGVAGATFVCPAAIAVAIEFRAAVATFMVMAYIIFANSSILGTLADSRGESPAFPAVLTVTCLSAGCLCILMGLMISFLVTGWLLIRRVPGALVMGILLASVAAVTLNLVFGRGRAFGTAAVLPTLGFGLGYGLGARGPSSDVLISGVSRPWDFQQRRW